ncbi:hypothetical protein [uncultured Nocardioides sp.]|uniref:hypothetical protein n=1 Tax=uncultured Nocardioides sp. TaxID=198441 RepID=UPI002618626F|nr:hypothetical protein [uncultured Nocardioides sp.]
MSTWGNNEPAPAGQAASRTPAQNYAGEVGRFVRTIRGTRIALLALIALGTLFMALASSDLALFAVLYGLVSGLFVHVVLGWLEHSLGLLSGIYLNGQAKPPAA